MSSGTRPGATRGIIERLFAEPPVNDADLARRLAGVNAPEARRILVERLTQVTAEHDGALVIDALERLGVGRERPRLLAVATDRSLSLRARSCAIALLSGGSARRFEALLARLAPNDAAELTELPLVDLLASIQAEPQRVGELTRAMTMVPPDGRSLLIGRIEHHRRRVGTPASAVYGALFDDPDFQDQHAQIVSILVDEACPDSVALLERARDRCADRAARRALQGAVLRARTRMIEPGHASECGGGHALVGSCDGQGAFIVIAGFQNLDGTLTIADLCIRVAADLRDGFVLPRQTKADLDRIVAEITEETGSRFAKVPLAEAAELVEQAVARTRVVGLDVPGSAQPAVALFERARRGAGGEVEAAAGEEGVARRCARSRTAALGGVVRSTGEATDAPSEAAVAKLLARPAYEAWFFDRGDLMSHGAVPPDRRAMARWRERTAACLDTPLIRRRLVAMAGFMARHHRWLGEHEEASLCAAAAREVEVDFRKSALLRTMLARSTDLTSEPQAGGFGDPELRRHLKDRFFQAVRKPKGRDLARLDLTEAAAAILSSSLASLPGERRPREGEASEAAYLLGRMFADHVTRGRKEPIGRLTRRMAGALAGACRLEEAEAWGVLYEVLPALVSFVDQVCAHCPAFCLGQPAVGMSELFFGPDHPAASPPQKPAR